MDSGDKSKSGSDSVEPPEFERDSSSSSIFMGFAWFVSRALFSFSFHTNLAVKSKGKIDAYLLKN